MLFTDTWAFYINLILVSAVALHTLKGAGGKAICQSVA